ncbi:hypothetical protein GCM10023339_08380 [Alloalcanivorax gelatiniphagus]
MSSLASMPNVWASAIHWDWMAVLGASTTAHVSGVFPELAGDGLEADAGLARPGRQHDPRPRVLRVVPRASEGLERFALVDAQWRHGGRVHVGHR